MNRSTLIIIFFRSHRSTKGPISGPRIIWGRKAISIAVASTVAEPVSTVKYQARANSTMALPNSDIVWLIQRTRNFLMEYLPRREKCYQRFLPGITFFASSQIFEMMWSIFPTPTIADAAIQRCPAQPLIDAVTLLAVMSGCASGITIRWFSRTGQNCSRYYNGIFSVLPGVELEVRDEIYFPYQPDEQSFSLLWYACLCICSSCRSICACITVAIQNRTLGHDGVGRNTVSIDYDYFCSRNW